MAHSPVTIANLGLSKIGEARINSITPPRSAIEKTVYENYGQWRDSELTIRRWVFATQKIILTLSSDDPIEDDERPYRFPLGSDVLRVVRERRSRWQVRGTDLYSPYDKETIEAIVRKPEGEFHALFVDVLAARVAKELVEPVTQSNEKWNKAQALYKDAINVAGRMNAFILEPDIVDVPDENSEWLTARIYGPGY